MSEVPGAARRESREGRMVNLLNALRDLMTAEREEETTQLWRAIRDLVRAQRETVETLAKISKLLLTRTPNPPNP